MNLLRCFNTVIVTIVLLGGCQAGPAGNEEITEDYFFPLPPDLPRVQFVRSFNSSEDFSRRRPFLDYLAGEKKPLQYGLSKPFSVATWKGRIYVTDSFGAKGLNVFDLENERFYIIGKELGRGELKKPIHVFVDDEGFKYISDRVKRQVVVYGPDDNYVKTYGDSRGFDPVACVTYGNEVYILDIMKDKVDFGESGEWDEIRRDQILVLDKETGKPLRRLGRHGSGQDGFSFASFLSIDRLGNLYISDFLNHRVVKMDAHGNVSAAFGQHGDGVGDFAQMKAVAIDHKGFIYVVDAAFQAVQVFDNGGVPLFAVGGPRAPKGPMDLPAGIWVDYHNLDYFKNYIAPDFEAEYLILVANQLSRENRLAVYAYGKKKGVEYPAEDSLIKLGNPIKKPLWKLPELPPEATSATLSDATEK